MARRAGGVVTAIQPFPKTTPQSALQDESHELVKTLRFANKRGLNEDYVESRRRAGATFESIEREQPEPKSFKVLEARTPKQEENSFFTRVFG